MVLKTEQTDDQTETEDLESKPARERKGRFFTPAIWVELSQKYIADALGADWQDEYYIWDCAAGTGNLLAGLTDKYRVWASTLDRQDVDVMHDRIKNGANLLEDHVFRFDFLNDGFEKLPKNLQAVIADPEKRKKMIVYINPPYAEDTNRRNTIESTFKGKVAQNKIHDKYAHLLKKANHELFAQFIARIYYEIPGAFIAEFSKLKILQSPNFAAFRKNFAAKLKTMFVVPADTFDNVKGQFPIGFKVWDTSEKEVPASFPADIYDKKGNKISNKTFFSYNDNLYINDWLKKYRKDVGETIGILNYRGNDFQHNSMVFIESSGETSMTRLKICAGNLIAACVYFAVRKCIEAGWLNDRDQFLSPSDTWADDIEFQNDCLAYTLFSNNIQSKFGPNHWIPFAERETGARAKYVSDFMPRFLAGKIVGGETGALFEKGRQTPQKPLVFSPEARAVFAAGKALWAYYHAQPGSNPDAALYDIREHFQGRAGNGKMNHKSGDDEYAALIAALRAELKNLAKKIAPKVYGHGFLKA